MYDAAFLARCFVENALHPLSDSETKCKGHFIKILFIDKETDFIYLPVISKERSVASFIPTYLRNSEPPVILLQI